MNEAELLSVFIGEIYDAALNASLWGAVLGKAAGFVGGPSASIYGKDATRKSGHIFYHDGGIEERYIRLYFEQYVKLDPSTTRHFFAEIEEPTTTTDIIPYDEFLETRFYKEWAKPQHLVDHVTAVLDKSMTSVALFGVFRHERDGLADDKMRRRMRLIVPHIRRSVLIGRLIDLKTAEAAMFAETLDGLSAGMFLIDAGGNIVHANLAGHAILSLGDFLRATSGRLTAADPHVDATLRDVFAAAGNGDMAIGIKGIALPLRAHDGQHFVAHVLPLTSGARSRASASYAAAAAVFVHKAELDTPSPPEVIARAYKLTPTELRVLLAVVEVGGVPEVAEALGVAETTVKTHLRSLFEKTGTGRQVDLAKLVAGFSNPIVG
jgi:DNA-binding CsgD family transcriptional regulator/PAS domain-containing protein